MGKSSAKTIGFLKSKFSDYYKDCDLYLPDRFGKREFGFLFFAKGMMQRHLSFGTKDDIRRFLVDRIPMHVYHSSAYYEKPGAPTMDEKGWLGADLIFDLDADHLKESKKLNYERMLAEVKREFVNLIENYILDDLGFSKKHITIVFSGARGYHLHIRDPKVMGLRSHERREIVDYLSPRTEDIDELVFEKVVYRTKKFRNIVKDEYIRRMPKKSDFGWKRKMRFGVENLLNDLRKMGKKDAIKYLAGFKGVGKVMAGTIWEALFEGKTKGGERMLQEDILEVFPSDKVRNAFIKIVVESQKVKLEGETDEPVTSDVKRLIRLPSSLHGKTGFVVKPIGFDQLEDFNPLTDAISESFATDEMRIEVLQPVDMELRGEKFNLGRGICKVPEYAAIFFMCRGMAKLP